MAAKDAPKLVAKARTHAAIKDKIDATVKNSQHFGKIAERCVNRLIELLAENCGEQIQHGLR